MEETQSKNQQTNSKVIEVSKNITIHIQNTIENFRGGKTAENIKVWKSITTDKWILNTIRGCTLELTDIPKQTFIPRPIKFSSEEKIKIQHELDRFIECGIIERASDDTANEFISNIFIRPKKDRRARIILNLKYFNENYVEKSHFKMESLRSAINMMRKDCFLASVDLSDAYYSVRIREQDRKYLRFIYDGQKWQFTSLVMGYSCSPRIWTKLMKPVFAYLRSKGHSSVYFIDDSCLAGNSYDTCSQNISDTIELMDNLGLTVNLTKSILTPCKKIVYLGFLFCTSTMTITLTDEKKKNIIEECKSMISAKRTTIRNFSKLIGKLIAAEPGVQHAPLYIRPLEKVKDLQLRKQRGNFDTFMKIPRSVHPILQWWIDNTQRSYKNISLTAPDVVIYTDASLQMYGAYNETSNTKTNGFWDSSEQKLHINILELKACEIGIHTLCKDINNKHLRLYTDNTTSCAYINRYGGKHESLDSIARRIWTWCIDRNIQLSAAHIAGSDNKEADKLSRSVNDDLEWSLDQQIFNKLHARYPQMRIDLFASNLNAKLEQFVSRLPTKNAFAVDAFSIQWTNHLFYIFPPFSLLPRIMQKIEEDKTQAIIIAPLWPTQVWWPELLRLTKSEILVLPPTQKILRLEHKPGTLHRLTKMQLAVFSISGRHWESEVFRKNLKTSFSTHGEKGQNSNTTLMLKNGYISVKGKQIPLVHL